MASHAAQSSAILLLLVCVINVTLACFITNCPPGGKRSLGDQKGATRQCAACGPGGLGRCYGPNLCCGPQVGCYLHTQESAICRFENLHPVACDNDAPSCAENGKCAADGLCCTTDECRVDESCHQGKDLAAHRMSSLYQRMLSTDVDVNDVISSHR